MRLIVLLCVFACSCAHAPPPLVSAVQEPERAELLVDVLKDLGAKSEGVQPDGTALACEPIGKWGALSFAWHWADGRAQIMLLRVHPEDDESYVEGGKRYTPLPYATRHFHSRDWACARAMR